MACGSIFVLLVAVKLLLPGRMAQVNAKLTGMLEQNIDVQAVFSAVGRAVSGEADVDVALQDMYQAVFDPQEDSAVEVSAPAGGEAVSLQLPAAIAPLRAFRTGTGSSDGWLDLPAAASQTAETAQTAEADQTAETAETASQGAAEASTLAYVLYSDQNLPDNVCLEQALLGFDYCTPVMGTLTSDFGYREHPVEGEERFHYGIDIGAAAGTEIGLLCRRYRHRRGGEQQLRQVHHRCPRGGLLHPVCPLQPDYRLLRRLCEGGGRDRRGGGDRRGHRASSALRAP